MDKSIHGEHVRGKEQCAKNRILDNANYCQVHGRGSNKGGSDGKAKTVERIRRVVS